MTSASRIRALRDGPDVAGRYVLYWMQRAQRAAHNPALEFAAAEANRRELPLVVGFGLMDGYPEANERHYAFMLEGLRETARRLAERGIAFVPRHGAPDRVAIGLAGAAALLVCDRGYLRHEKAWRAAVAASVRCPVREVESDVVVPVERASDKAEIAARTLRPKIARLLDAYVRPLAPVALRRPALDLGLAGDVAIGDPAAVLRRLDLDRTIGPVSGFTGGGGEARRRPDAFIADGLARYDERRREPAAGATSHLSPYLHFGQISPVEIVLALRAAGGAVAAKFIDELVIRRELAANFVNFTADYDAYAAMPAWARRTLAAHEADPRPALYDEAALEEAATHDPYWNAAMREMRLTGYMHNTMRMYWGKKILEWSPSPAAAHRSALALNNRYLLDGRDANSFANIGWLFGLHDRPWFERPVFGTVRSMTAAGLERKFDIAAYVAAVDRLARRGGAPAQP